jgi:hypothetical protein
MRGAAITLVIILTVGCDRQPVEQAPDAAPAPTACPKVPAHQDLDVDILFVIDNSASMEQEQKRLMSSFPGHIAALKDPVTGNLPNLRIGVVTTDLGAGKLYVSKDCKPDGDKGKLKTTSTVTGCSMPTDPWIEIKFNKTNVPGAGDAVSKVSNAFSCLSAVGLAGCGFEQPLLSAVIALDPAGNVNPGFLRNDDPCKAGREDAMLAVVFLTDEDDCSAANLQLFDPSKQGLSDPLGPFTSFRCFEFGVRCQCPGKAKCDRSTKGPRKNCVPTGEYLHKVENIAAFFQNLKKGWKRDPATGKCVARPAPERVFMAAVAGPTEPVEVEFQGGVPLLKASCSSSMGYALPAIRVAALVHTFAQLLTDQEIADIKAKKKNIPYWVDGAGVWREQNFTPICSSSFDTALKRLAARFKQARGTRCADFPGK